MRGVAMRHTGTSPSLFEFARSELIPTVSLVLYMKPTNRDGDWESFGVRKSSHSSALSLSDPLTLTVL